MKQESMIVVAVTCASLAGGLLLFKNWWDQPDVQIPETPVAGANYAQAALAVRPPVDPRIRAAVHQLPDPVVGLTEKDGFLGARSAISQDGQQLISFIWFKNESSLLRWYDQRVRKDLLVPHFPEVATMRPRFVGARGDGPVMAVASITPSLTRPAMGKQVAYEQISFEVYSVAGPPMAIGESFAPTAVARR